MYTVKTFGLTSSYLFSITLQFLPRNMRKIVRLFNKVKVTNMEARGDIVVVGMRTKRV